MCRALFASALLLCVATAQAVDASRAATRSFQSGSWKVIEFAGAQQLVYRLVSDSTNEAETHLAFDMAPSDRCEPRPAVMIRRMDRFLPDLADGLIPMTFKVPGQSDSPDLAKTAMRPDDPFAFFQFSRLTAQAVAQAHDRGSLATWIPGSGDGSVKRSSNIYFALDGFENGLARARRMCLDNR